MVLTTIILSILLIITAIVTLYYWADFFLKGAVHVIEEELYKKFEKSFPVADLWGLVVCSLFGAVGLLTEQSYGPFFAFACSRLHDIFGSVEYNFQYTKRYVPFYSWLKRDVI